MSDFRTDERLRWRQSKVAIALLQASEFSKGTVGGLIDVSEIRGVMPIEQGRINEVNKAWTFVIHSAEHALSKLSDCTIPLRVRPAAGNMLGINFARLQKFSQSMRTFRDRIVNLGVGISTAGMGMGEGTYLSNVGPQNRVAEAAISGTGSKLIGKLESWILDGRPIEVYGQAVQYDPADFELKAFKVKKYLADKGAPQILMTWPNPTVAQVAQAVRNYLSRYGLPGENARSVRTAVLPEQPYSLEALETPRFNWQNLDYNVVVDLYSGVDSFVDGGLLGAMKKGGKSTGKGKGSSKSSGRKGGGKR